MSGASGKTHTKPNSNPTCVVRGVVFDSAVVQIHRTMRSYWKVAKPALAGMLAGLLVLIGTLSASHFLHQTLHASSNGANHSCIVCAFSKGQVSAADGLAVLLVFVSACTFVMVRPSILLLSASDYRLLPSRAPPVS